MTNWYETQAGLWEKAWQALAAGGKNRFVTLSTISANGPESRLVVLRRADVRAASLTLYTDATSTKCAEIAADPRATLHHWSEHLDLQVRLKGTAQIETGETLRSEWNALRGPLKGSYGVKPAPGTPIAASDAYTRVPDFQQFAKLTVTATSIDIVHLSPDHHRRVLFTKAKEWSGEWLAP